MLMHIERVMPAFTHVCIEKCDEDTAPPLIRGTSIMVRPRSAIADSVWVFSMMFLSVIEPQRPIRLVQILLVQLPRQHSSI